MSTTRVLSGLALIPILFVVVWFLPPAYFAGLAVAGGVIGQGELYTMAKARGGEPLRMVGALLGSLLILNVYSPLYPHLGGAVFWI
ncbi:MAG: hypothetical protein ACYC7L_17910, partial [Nitrospirota bacterium]